MRVDDEVVEAGVEGFGDAGGDVEAGGDAAVFVAADLAGVGADLFGELALGPAVFGAEFLDAVSEGHVVASGFVTWTPLWGG